MIFARMVWQASGCPMWNLMPVSMPVELALAFMSSRRNVPEATVLFWPWLAQVVGSLIVMLNVMLTPELCWANTVLPPQLQLDTVEAAPHGSASTVIVYMPETTLFSDSAKFTNEVRAESWDIGCDALVLSNATVVLVLPVLLTYWAFKVNGPLTVTLISSQVRKACWMVMPTSLLGRPLKFEVMRIGENEVFAWLVLSKRKFVTGLSTTAIVAMGLFPVHGGSGHWA